MKTVYVKTDVIKNLKETQVQEGLTLCEYFDIYNGKPMKSSILKASNGYVFYDKRELEQKPNAKKWHIYKHRAIIPYGAVISNYVCFKR